MVFDVSIYTQTQNDYIAPHTHMARRLMKKIGIFYANLTIWRYLFINQSLNLCTYPLVGINYIVLYAW